MSSTTTDSEWQLGHKRSTGWSVSVLCLSSKEKEQWVTLSRSRVSLFSVLSLHQMHYVNEVSTEKYKWVRETRERLTASCPVTAKFSFNLFTAFRVRALEGQRWWKLTICTSYIIIFVIVIKTTARTTDQWKQKWQLKPDDNFAVIIFCQNFEFANNIFLGHGVPSYSNKGVLPPPDQLTPT